MEAKKEDIKIYGKLVNVTTENVVADAQQIWDSNFEENQQNINKSIRNDFNSFKKNEAWCGDITYIPTESAKIVFEYAIVDTANGELMASARSMQVFTDTDYQLLLDNPEFYRIWKQEHQVF